MTITNAVDIQELISGKGFIMVNKGLAKMVGLVPATIYGELVSTFQYWKGRNSLTEIDGKEWFFCTLEDLEDKTTIKKDAQSKAIKTLEKEGLIITKRHGLPAKRYFHLTDKYVQLLVDNYFTGKPQTDNTNDSGDENGQKPQSNQIAGKPQTGLLENRKQDLGKTATNKKVSNNNSFNKKQSTNSLSIDNYQEPENSGEEISATTIEEPKELSTIQLPESSPEEVFTEACNEFYTTFAIGRWNKKAWNTLVTSFVSETIANGRHKTTPPDKVSGYVYKALENIAKHHDYKHSEEYQEYKETMKEVTTDLSFEELQQLAYERMIGNRTE